MAIATSFGFNDTAIEGVSSLNFPRGLINMTDWRKKTEKPGSEIVITNFKTPSDQPEKLRIGYTEVSNVYNGTGVDASYMAPSKRGIQLLVQDTAVLKVTDSVDPTFAYLLPISAHLVLKAPVSEHVTANDILTVVGRLLSGLFDTGAITSTQLEAYMRGALTPSGLR